MDVFLLMPFEEKFNGVSDTIKDVCKKVGLDCKRVDDRLESGKITEDIERDIRCANICIADLSGSNHNVLWELGFASALGKPVILIDSDSKENPFNFKDQRKIEYELNMLETTLVHKLEEALKKTVDKVHKLSIEDYYNVYPNTNISSALALKRINDSPFDLERIIKSATKRLFLSAQNHFFMIDNGAKFKKEIFDFLLEDKEREVQIMLCDPDFDEAVETWKIVTREQYSSDLYDSLNVLKTWAENWVKVKKEKPEKCGKLEIRKTKFVPLSLNFVDPGKEDGFLVMVPNTYEEKAKIRPCFVVSNRKNPDILVNYLSAYEQRFNNSDLTKIIV